MKSLVAKIARWTVFASALLALTTTFANAQEVSSGNLILRATLIKTNSEIIALPKAPTTMDAFLPTWVFCPPGSPCTLEITMTSELSDVSPGVDSLRYVVTVDNSIVDVLPTTNLGINSTAKAGQMESGTGTWMRKNLAPGYHLVRVSATVNDTNGDGVVSGYLGDRSVIFRVYSLQ
jgi:hypothetical protein